ncbi:Ppx/GppA phosphatase family protein [Cellulosilyticum sp. I15G10I2]|uniref:Ppx/GppA phosphatase family protein n=1 Tax=Cellulosilyticum sp. I15G10I2 TaxID=1892843 RepID=UPI00085BB721|nr:hypothetical protein [Cellulosilyticum sp. I15G10I2]
MHYGLIDLGSNTVRLVIYKFNQNKYVKVFDEKTYLGILNYIEKNQLTSQGIEKLKRILIYMYGHIQLMGCNNYWCFATASLRNIDNLEAVVELIKQKAGLTILPITGTEEAYYDYVSLKNSLLATSFIGCDIGGGSAQIIECKDKNLIASTSLPIGSLRMYKDHVEGFFPNTDESQKITTCVEKHLDAHSFISNNSHKTLYAIGGTARATAKLHRELSKNNNTLHGYVLTPQDLDMMQQTIDHLGIQGAKVINKVLPERLLTIIPGMIVLQTLVNKMNIQQIVILKKGIREGFLIEKLMDGDYNERKKI